MKKATIPFFIVLVFSFCFSKAFAQLHTRPTCGQNFNLNWVKYNESDGYYWKSGQLSNTYINVNNSQNNITIAFTGETKTLGFWGGNTPKVGSKSCNLYQGLDLLSKGFSGTGITCTITFSKPIYALSFDIHHITKRELNGEKFTVTGKDKNGNTIFPDFTNSPNPTYTSNNDTGIVNAISNNAAGNNAVVGVNFSDPNHIKSISFLWQDCNTCNNDQLNVTGLGNISFCMPQTMDFDGVDDYINTNAFLGGKSEITMMSWLKLDKDSNGGEIMGQRNFRLYIDSNKSLSAFIKPNIGLDIQSQNLSELILKEELWYHVALKFNSSTGNVTLFLNGNSIWNYTDNTLIGKTINNTEDWNLNHDFEIGRNSQNDNNYFEGSIYECRVYNKALTQIQLHQQINQEIENDNGNIKGSVIPKNIEGLLWSDLILYFNMKNIESGYTIDKSNNNLRGKLNNMTIFQKNQDYTAPLPYTTSLPSNGNWNDAKNWQHGHVWDINETIPTHAIVKVKGDLEVNTNLNTTGLIIDKGGILKVSQNSALINSWYLKLDGILDLEGESQLIQTEHSTLEKTSSGILKKDLQGTADKFTYNYWSSPVGKTNNSSTNNPYSVKDIFTNLNFLTIGHNGMASPISIADYWIWKFNNRLSDNFSSWQHVRSSGEIMPGEGFTMKGPGTGSSNDKQNYTLQGKPNNGDISLTVYAGNDYLIGNPYPSAIDAVKFIQDNKSNSTGERSSNGTLYFWKHWGGNSHIANEYQGGYAAFSLSGSVPAASKILDNNIISLNGGSDDIPGRYISIGQGFYTTAETNGVIKFTNAQRIFHLEHENTEAFRYADSKNKTPNTNDSRMTLRISLNSVNAIQRQLLITVDENATSGYDWGYDSKYIDTQVDDMYWLIENNKYIIQGVNEINKQTVIPLGIHTKTDGFNSINIDALKNTDNIFDIYLHDKDLNVYHSLKESKYEVYLVAGEYLNRFEITFSKNSTLANQKNENNQIEIYFSNETNKIIINNPASKLIEFVEMYNILGQALFKFQPNTKKKLIEYNTEQIKSGNYILKIETEFGMMSKKVFLK